MFSCSGMVAVDRSTSPAVSAVYLLDTPAQHHAQTLHVKQWWRRTVFLGINSSSLLVLWHMYYLLVMWLWCSAFFLAACCVVQGKLIFCHRERQLGTPEWKRFSTLRQQSCGVAVPTRQLLTALDRRKIHNLPILNRPPESYYYTLKYDTSQRQSLAVKMKWYECNERRFALASIIAYGTL